MPLMKSWVDTAVARKDTWLVLVIHGVDGLGYEAVSDTLLNNYFHYIKNRGSSLWIATFGDVTKYMRERKSVMLKSNKKGYVISINITNPLDKSMYNIPLTLKTYVPAKWEQVIIDQGTREQKIKPAKDAKGSYVIYQVSPNGKSIALTMNLKGSDMP